MPTKSTREMSVLERMRHSLSARTFRAVLALALILSLTAISFGFYLFRETMTSPIRMVPLLGSLPYTVPLAVRFQHCSQEI